MTIYFACTCLGRVPDMLARVSHALENQDTVRTKPFSRYRYIVIVWMFLQSVSWSITFLVITFIKSHTSEFSKKKFTIK